MRYHILILFLHLIRTTLCQNNFEKVFDLSEIDTNRYSFIDDLIKDKQVIALGEIEHGDGTTFIEKTNLIKYLHDKHGFNVILFESPFSQMGLINQNPTLKLNYKNLVGNIFNIWSKVEETQPLFNYAQSEKIQISGFDCQYPKNEYNIQDTIQTRFFNKIDSFNNKGKFISTLKILLNNYGKSRRLISKKEKSNFISIINFLIDANKKDTVLNDSFWRQTLISIKGYAIASWKKNSEIMDANYIRDEYMANNLLWLINNKYKNEKIVVWAHSEHICSKISGSEKDKATTQLHLKMGDYIRTNLKGKLYTISFICNEGNTLWAGENYVIKREPQSLEGILSKKFKYAFIETKNLDSIRVNGYATHNKYGVKTLKWNSVCDAFYFIKEMQKSTYISK